MVTFRTGRGGRSRKPKIPTAEDFSEESSLPTENYESTSKNSNNKSLPRKNTWGAWALRTLSRNSHILQNYLIRPVVMMDVLNDPQSHLVNNRFRTGSFLQNINNSHAKASIKRSNTAEGMYAMLLKKENKF